MARSMAVALFVLATTVVASLAAAPAPAGAAAGPVDSVGASDGTETTGTDEPTPTPDDGPDGHADDPFPRWLPVAFAGGLVVGIAIVGGGIWAVYTRIRRFLGR